MVVLLGVAASLVIRVPRPDGQASSAKTVRFDSEIGWAPIRTELTVVGQRADPVDPQRDHVVVVGDSVGYGHGLADDKTAVHFLGRQIDDYQVLNLSVTGWSIDQYYLYLKRLLPSLRAKFVVVYLFTGNDYQGTTQSYMYGHEKPLFTVAGGELSLIHTDLSELSCTGHFSKTLFMHPFWWWGVNNGRREAVADSLAWVCGDKKLKPEIGDRVISMLFEAIDELVRDHGAQLVYVLLPRTSDYIEPSRLEDLPWPTLEFFRHLLQATDYPVLDFGEVVAASGYCKHSSDQGGGCTTESIFLDGAHYNETGSRFLAETTHRFLRDRFGVN